MYEKWVIESAMRELPGIHASLGAIVWSSLDETVNM